MITTRKKRIGIKPLTDLIREKLIPSEYQECKVFWRFAQLRGFSEDLIKHANERMGDPPWYIKALYAIGFCKGLLDYQYIVPNLKYHSLWIEMKRKDQEFEKKKPEQDQCIARLLKNGHYASYAYGADHAIKIYTDYVNNKL